MRQQHDNIFFFNLCLVLLVISLRENFHSPALLFLCEEDSIRVKYFPLPKGWNYEGKPENTWPSPSGAEKCFEKCLPQRTCVRNVPCEGVFGVVDCVFLQFLVRVHVILLKIGYSDMTPIISTNLSYIFHSFVSNPGHILISSFLNSYTYRLFPNQLEKKGGVIY